MDEILLEVVSVRLPVLTSCVELANAAMLVAIALYLIHPRHQCNILTGLTLNDQAMILHDQSLSPWLLQ